MVGLGAEQLKISNILFTPALLNHLKFSGEIKVSENGIALNGFS